MEALMRYLIALRSICDVFTRHTRAFHIHRDPFDRLFIAQAMTEGMKLITRDAKIVQYYIETVW